MDAIKWIGMLTLSAVASAEFFTTLDFFNAQVGPLSYQRVSTDIDRGFSLSAGSTVKVNVTFRRTADTIYDNLFVEAIWTPDTGADHVDSHGHIGFGDDDLRVCCNADTFGMHGCDEKRAGTVIIPDPKPGSFRQQVFFERRKTTQLTMEIQVAVDGVYMLAVAACDPHLQLANDSASMTFVRGEIHCNQTRADAAGYDSAGLGFLEKLNLLAHRERVPIFIVCGLVFLFSTAFCCVLSYSWWRDCQRTTTATATEGECALLEVS